MKLRDMDNRQFKLVETTFAIPIRQGFGILIAIEIKNKLRTHYVHCVIFIIRERSKEL